MIGRLRAAHADTRGATLTELLVGTVIGAMIMGVVATTIFTTNDLRLHVDDRNTFASDLAIASLSFDRDGAMAPAGAPAQSQTTSTSCATAIDLGFDEGGSSVRYRTVSGRLERVSGSGTRTMARNISACTWQAVRETATSPYTILVRLTMTGVSGETIVGQILRAAPRSWL